MDKSPSLTGASPTYYIHIRVAGRPGFVFGSNVVSELQKTAFVDLTGTYHLIDFCIESVGSCVQSLLIASLDRSRPESHGDVCGRDKYAGGCQGSTARTTRPALAACACLRRRRPLAAAAAG